MLLTKDKQAELEKGFLTLDNILVLQFLSQTLKCTTVKINNSIHI